MVSRRHFGLMLAAATAAASLVGRAAAQTRVTDMLGRQIALDRPPSRIVLLDARDVLSMALVHPDPSSLIVGWAAVEMIDSALVRSQYETRPDGRPISTVGALSADTVSAEGIIRLEPDLVIATAYMVPELAESDLVRRLAAAGVPVLFSDVSSNSRNASARDPFAELPRLMAMWGTILGREAQAPAYAAFVQEHLDGVKQRLATVAPVRTYLEIQSTYEDCCWAAGTRIWGDLLNLAGGSNLKAVEAPWFAKVSLEQLIREEPDVYIASGGAFGGDIRPAIGPGMESAKGKEGLRRLTERTGFDILPAVQQGKVHGIWTGLVALAPLNILFLEVAAKWLHPKECADLDPAETLSEINRRFLAKPLTGHSWLSLTDQ